VSRRDTTATKLQGLELVNGERLPRWLLRGAQSRRRSCRRRRCRIRDADPDAAIAPAAMPLGRR